MTSVSHLSAGLPAHYWHLDKRLSLFCLLLFLLSVPAVHRCNVNFVVSLQLLCRCRWNFNFLNRNNNDKTLALALSLAFLFHRGVDRFVDYINNDISCIFEFVCWHRFRHDSRQGFRHCSDIWRHMTWYIRCMFCRWRTTAECSVASTSRCHRHCRVMYTSWTCELCSLTASCLAGRLYQEVHRWHWYFIGQRSTAVSRCCSPLPPAQLQAER